MRQLYFLLPGTTPPFGGGGLWAQLKTIALAQQVCPAELVTYRQRERDRLFLDDLLHHPDFKAGIFVVSWGFDVPKLVKKLHNYPMIYHAHSAGYGFSLPSTIPIISVSRNTMGYWGQKSPNSLIYYLPNQIGDEFRDLEKERDIDVLVQVRKSSDYLLNQLIPALRSRCRVELLDGYIEDLAGLFNRSKVYLYDSAEYWATSGVTEGFGLPPLEAIACGCQVFSSVNSALADYLDPGFNGYKIAGYSLDYDLSRILNVVNSPDRLNLPKDFLEPYRSPSLIPRLQVILTEINDFFDRVPALNADIASLTPWRLRKRWTLGAIAKVKRRVFKSRL